MEVYQGRLVATLDLIKRDDDCVLRYMEMHFGMSTKILNCVFKVWRYFQRRNFRKKLNCVSLKKKFDEISEKKLNCVFEKKSLMKFRRKNWTVFLQKKHDENFEK